MKLLIVRHGDPDYTIDSLTPKGWKEVDYLSEKLAKLDVKAFYVSPLGRARDTASLTLKKMNLGFANLMHGSTARMSRKRK